MKCAYTTRSGQMTFEFEAADAKDLFAQRAMIELHDEEGCGVCKGTHIRCEVRRTGEYTYYEMRCQNRQCNARLDFGQYKDMKNLFVKRDAHPETNGWYIYDGREEEREEEQRSPGKFATPAPTHHANGTNGKPAQPAQAAQPAKKPLTIEEKHKLIVGNYQVSATVAKLNEWAAWSAKHDFPPHMQEEQADAYHAAMMRLSPAAPDAPPVPDEAIPF